MATLEDVQPRSRHSRVTHGLSPMATPEEARCERLRYIEKEIKYLEDFFKVTIGAARFGGSIMFTLILTDIREPNLMTRPRPAVQSLLALSWLLLIAALGIASVL
jgi:hypothetical protein